MVTRHRGPSRHRMRRNARKLRRYGIEPMVMVTDDLDLGSVVAAVITRALWRYRSELAPLACSLTAALAGWILHRIHPNWWPIILAVTASTAPSLAIAGHRLGLAWRAERIYAATVALSAGSWLAAATALGPLHRPLPQLLLIGGLVLAVPWWAHRRRRARVRVQRTIEAWPQAAQNIGLAGSQITSAVADLWGWRARVALSRGQTVEDAVAKLPAIESALGTRRGAVRVLPIPERADRFELRVVERDPHADAITSPGAAISTITQPAELGVFEDGSPVRVPLLRRHLMVGGVTGAGKSGLLNVILDNLAACRDVVIWGVDLRGGTELMPWSSCLDRLATTPEAAEELLRDAVAILDGRAAALADAGQRVWEPSPGAPELVVLVDEFAELAGQAPQANRYADSIARRGRAEAVNLIIATQRPSRDAMGKGAVRSQMDVRICLRVRERRDVDLILGQGMLAAGWHAEKLDAPGKFLISSPGHDTPRRARAYLLDDDMVGAAVRRHAGRLAAARPSLGQRPRHRCRPRHGKRSRRPRRPAARPPLQRPACGQTPRRRP